MPATAVCLIAGVAGTPACYGGIRKDPVSKALINDRHSAPPPVAAPDADFAVPREARLLQFQPQRIEVGTVYLRRTPQGDDKNPAPAPTTPAPSANPAPAPEEPASPTEQALQR